MTNTAHKNLAGADLHEPKGIATATATQVYRADGAGSGSWQTITIPTGLFTVTITTFTASGTWTKPANLFKARIHVVGSGGPSGSATVGGSTSFGAHCSATGGAGNNGSAAAGGTGSSGSLNLSGESTLSTVGTLNNGGFSGGPFPNKGRGANDPAGNPGAGGGYSMKEVAAAALGSTETVTLGTAGANNGFVMVEEYLSI